MSISIPPNQSSNYWYARENSVSLRGFAGLSTTYTSQAPEPNETLPSVVVNLSGKTPRSEQSPQSEKPNGFSETSQSQENKSSQPTQTGRVSGLYNKALSEEELNLLEQLKNSDSEVRSHEMAHIAAGGQYVTSGARLEYRKGPDGKNYAVAGEVSIDTSTIAGDPEATIAKMRQVQMAALAPASPSNQDRKVASSAGAIAADALSDLIMLQAKKRTEGNENKAFGGIQDNNTDYGNTQNESRSSGAIRSATKIYSKISAMPMEPQMNFFKIAV